MSRGAWDDARTSPVPPATASGSPDGGVPDRSTEARELESDERRGDERGGNGGTSRSPDPRRPEARQPVRSRDRWHRLRDADWDTLRTVGTFRVVDEADLLERGRSQEAAGHDLDYLIEDGLLERRTAIVSQSPTHLVTLTEEGSSLLDAHRGEAGEHPGQQYHTGVVKPRELAHDVYLYRAAQAETARLAGQGARVTRVVLDYELKRDYQRFLQRRDRDAHASVAQDREAFARVHGLAVVDDHLVLPDLRLEVEYADGRRDVRDVEVVTEHYSRGQLSGKAQAGFSCYRPARTRFGHGTSRGGAPTHSRALEWLG